MAREMLHSLDPQRMVFAHPESPQVVVVGPAPPPSGGMANQCEQLTRLLKVEGVQVIFVRTNEPYFPAWIGRVPAVRAFCRLIPFVRNLWKATSKADVVHIFANSGWAWYFFCAPAMVIGRLCATPVIVNYRGGNADPFLEKAPRFVLRMLANASLIVTPSAFLKRVFSKYGLDAQIIPNIIDLSRFRPRDMASFGDSPHVIVTRNLEPIYDIPTALKAFSIVVGKFPNARLTVAGTGPELASLRLLASELNLTHAVTFSGRIDNANIPQLYASADCMINSSTVDNMPISILEALACGVPVVSTSAGGIPDMVEQGVSALLVPVGDSEAIARDVIRVLDDPQFAAQMVRSGVAEARKYSWPQVRSKWLDAYAQSARKARPV